MPVDDRRAHLYKLLEDPDPQVQASASRALEYLEAYQNFGNFIQEIKQNHTPRQVQGVYGLARVLGQQAYRILLQLLKHPKLDVAAAAARVLVQRRDPRLLKGVLELYKELPPLVKQLMLELFAYFRDPRAVEPILLEIQGYEGELLEEALKTLGEIADPRAEATLIQYLSHNDPRIRSAAALALGKLLCD